MGGEEGMGGGEEEREGKDSRRGISGVSGVEVGGEEEREGKGRTVQEALVVSVGLK